jgi:hypothetical protein
LAAPPPPPATALPPGFKKDLTPKRRQTIPESAFKDGPRGLRYADLKTGSGPDAKVGDRVVVHYEAKWKGVTFMTSRQGEGVRQGAEKGGGRERIWKKTSPFHPSIPSHFI